MKILFHPSFDSGYYIHPSKSQEYILGTKIVGIHGLLEHLTLHNGCSGRFASDGERAASYLTHVSRCAEGSMIKASFANDSLGVARCLLQWRDQLLMAGWTPALRGNGQTPKLQLLCDIEQSWKAQMKGTADRWLELAALARHQRLLEEGDEVECCCQKEQLPKLIQLVLESCQAKFTAYTEEVQLQRENVHVIHYKDLSEAYQHVASHTAEYADKVIINRDNVSLNHMLYAWGEPLTNATIQESNPLTLQLFKLAMSVFSRPLNIQNLLSYLQLPIGPIPGKLRYALANILVAEGGFGTERTWDQVIADYVNDSQEEGSKAQREAKAALLRHITDGSLTPDGAISTEILTEYIDDIVRWASAVANGEDEENEKLKAQLSTAVSYFKQLRDALAHVDSIAYQDLEKHIRTIYQPMAITQSRAQSGSLHVVSNYSQLLDAPDETIWLDCCGADVAIDPYEFLSAAERSWLQQEGVCMPLLKERLELARKEMLTCLAKTKGKITLVTSDYHHNTRMAEHPLVAELRMMSGEAFCVEVGHTSLPRTEEKDIVTLQPQLQYRLGEIGYIERRESNTSIDKLINYPFDYTVNYIARLKESADKSLGSLNQVTGLVAHLFVQNLVNDVKAMASQDRLDTMMRLLEEDFDTRLDQAVKATGLMLLLKENKVEYNNLPFLLKRSVMTLISIMKEKDLTPVGCELLYEDPLSTEINDFNARIDMEQEDHEGKTVIFDFKWTYSTFYSDKIREGKALQLELYRQELEKQGKKVTAVGYYLMPKCLLVTPDYDNLMDQETGKLIIEHIAPPQGVDVFSQIENSVRQRKDEIKAGDIEEGECQDIMGLPYATRMIEREDLLQIGKIKRDGRKSKNNPNPPVKEISKDSNMVFTNAPESRFVRARKEFDNAETPSNEKPTTYPLMKGRLK